MFSQVPFKWKLGRRASPGREKNPGVKHTGVRDFTPTTVPTLPKKLINSILGMFGGGEHSGSPFSATIISFSNVAETILPPWHHGVRGAENLSIAMGNTASTAGICTPQKVCPSPSAKLGIQTCKAQWEPFKAASYSTLRSLTDGRKAAWHSFRMVQFRGRGASVWFMTPSKFHQENQKPQTWAMPRKQKVPHDPGIPWSSPHLRIPSGQRLPATWETSQVALSHWTFLRKPPPLSLQPCSCIPNVAEWRHTACCFGEGMHGFEGEGQPAQNSLWSESEQPARNARSLSCSPPSKRRSGIGGKPGPFALLTWFGGEPGREQKGTSIKPKRGTCTFLYKASLRAGNWHRGRG